MPASDVHHARSQETSAMADGQAKQKQNVDCILQKTNKLLKMMERGCPKHALPFRTPSHYANADSTIIDPQV